MKKLFLTMIFSCILGAGFINSVNAKVASDCNAAHLAAYDAARDSGLSHDQAVDVADKVYRACAGIK